ncbi:unnamed protein product, partial [Linum tenue]
IYRPIWAAFPNNPTRRQRLVVRQGPGTTGLSPSLAPLSRGLGPSPPLRTLLQTTIRVPWALDSQAGHYPVRSPLLRESCSQRHPQPTTSFSANHKALVRPREANIRSHPREGIGRRCVTPRQTALNRTASGATCVQKLDGSRDSAIHTKYRISLRSSSMREPRYPLPRVVVIISWWIVMPNAPRLGRRQDIA